MSAPQPLSLDLLAIFAAVAETASFSAAANKLGVTKGTVSRGIARLEEALGTELVHRTTRSVALSTAGTALFEKTASHLTSLRCAVGTLPEREQEPAGELRITATADFGVAVLPEVVARFTRRHPGVTLDVHVTNRTIDLVAEGFDLAIRGASQRLENSSLASRKLCALEAHLYAAPSYLARRGTPRAVGDADHDWVLARMIPLRTVGLPRGFRPRVQSDDFGFVRELLRAGGGVGFLPTFLADPAVAAGELVRVLAASRRLLGGFFLVYPSSGQVPRKVAAFRDFLVEAVAARS